MSINPTYTGNDLADPLDFDPWYQSHANLHDLAIWLEEREPNFDWRYFLEKPWKWETDWDEFTARYFQRANA